MAAPIPLIKSAADAGRVLTARFLALDTYSSRAAVDLETPRLLVAMPPLWANKYQILLYGSAARHRYATVGITSASSLQHISWPGPIVLHAHWFASQFKGAQSEAEAKSKLDELCEHILQFRARTGAKLLWTAHNIFPHGNPFPETFLDLRRWIVEHFDAIHLLQSEHQPLLEEAYGCSLKANFSVPHMTYCGTILDSVDRDTARTFFRLPQDAFVFSYFGSVQPYKKLDRLLEAFARLAGPHDRTVGLLIGGNPSDNELGRQLQLKWGLRSNIRLMLRKVPDAEIQYFHHAADVMVFPYEDTLNSGAALMATTYRKPFIMPEGSASRPLKSVGAITFDPAAPDGLLKAMKDVMEGKRSARWDEDTLAALRPKQISDRFFGQLESLLQRPSAVGSLQATQGQEFVAGVSA